MMRDIFFYLDNESFSHEFCAEALASIMPHITNPELSRQAVLAYRKYIIEHEAKVIENKPLTEADSVFLRITDPYKGNVLNIDFWSMSCGPCRSGMLRDREDVEQYKDKPVKYLYVTYDKPETCNRWMDENKIKGEHIFITGQEWSLLQEKFSFSGIPFHVTVDKEGKVRTDVSDFRQLLDK